MQRSVHDRIRRRAGHRRTVATLADRLANWLEREYADAEVVSVLGI